MKQKYIKLYNPDSKDFSVQYDGESYLIHAMEIEEYPEHIANHIKKHLATHLMYKRGIKHNPSLDHENIVKEIEVA